MLRQRPLEASAVVTLVLANGFEKAVDVIAPGSVRLVDVLADRPQRRRAVGDVSAVRLAGSGALELPPDLRS